MRAFLISQSLNQIDKAYAQNHSILDNCQVRETFATNDERTAKRISETLDTVTELRAAQLCRSSPARSCGAQSTLRLIEVLQQYRPCCIPQSDRL
ncbi:hypothetical protein PCA10_35820 [Metapseudomonas resinovorans NBRC 106553]|uniref:TraD/TraG TraM recognition site domain-containing protein n=1 Tax=Metapseudomonas resinovorans NBRC 106553 TaxID=1245471 RepID=S6BJD5_METRE|nr:hypothetical protein PCA10_35820 [Pseudomonas resinovorans NBRC 106553]